MVLVFELFAVPHLTPRLGVQMSQRVGSVVLVPVYIFLPMLSSVNGAHLAVTVASLILLFTCYVCSHAVSAFRFGRASNRRDGEHKQVRVSTDCKLSAAASVKNTHPHSRHTFRCCRTFSRACVSALVSELVAYSVAPSSIHLKRRHYTIRKTAYLPLASSSTRRDPHRETLSFVVSRLGLNGPSSPTLAFRYQSTTRRGRTAVGKLMAFRR